eukprot:NODE_269_length_12236_cov_0.516932.p8 type:complete len:122 gc:universal NODE_269_length_12236_cov_0.516932:6164-6529(+)
MVLSMVGRASPASEQWSKYSLRMCKLWLMILLVRRAALASFSMTASFLTMLLRLVLIHRKKGLSSIPCACRSAVILENLFCADEFVAIVFDISDLLPSYLTFPIFNGVILLEITENVDGWN